MLVYLSVIGGIALLIWLIIGAKINPFMSLLIAAIVIGLGSGMDYLVVFEQITKGMGDTLGFVATIIGLGVIFGAILEHSGGAHALALFLIKKAGKKNTRTAMLFSGFLVAIPVFFDVAFVMLYPIAKGLAAKFNKNVVYFTLPLLTGIALTHSFIPPTPGPVAVADILGVEIGSMIRIGLLVTLPVALVCGLFVTKKLSASFEKEASSSLDTSFNEENSRLQRPDFILITHISLLLPLLLMVTAAILKSSIQLHAHLAIKILLFLGHPFSALLIATFFAIYVLAAKAKIERKQLEKIITDSLAPAGAIILITGAGGSLKQILIATGIGTQLASQLPSDATYIILFAFGAAAIVRALQGSATIAMLTAAGLTAPIIAINPQLAEIDKTFVALAIASGSVILSHVNDSGFWIVNRLQEQKLQETLKTWTILSTTISLCGLLVILIYASLWKLF